MNIQHGSTTVVRSDEVAKREEEFTRTFVSKYFLPNKLSQARRKGRKAVLVPVDQLVKLLERAGVES